VYIFGKGGDFFGAVLLYENMVCILAPKSSPHRPKSEFTGAGAFHSVFGTYSLDVS